MLYLPLDSDSRSPRFYNVSAHVDVSGRIHLNGAYDASDLIPVLLFSVGVPWVEPCLRHVCCLWDVLDRYRDHALMDVLGSPCDEHVNLTSKDLTRGNGQTKGRWDVNTMIHPSFVAMLFLCLNPVFYMYYEIVPVEWEAGSVHWSSSWYGQPCHQVTYTDGRKLCIYCANEKPDNARFVFTPNWFQTFQCKWECLPGFMGPGCELSTGLVVSIGAGAVGMLCMGFIGVLLVSSSVWWRGYHNNNNNNNKHLMDIEKTSSSTTTKYIDPLIISTQQLADLTTTVTRSTKQLAASSSSSSKICDVISFKEDGIHHDIRIKLL